MSGYELLAYVVAFAICLGLVLAIAGGIFMYFTHKKYFNEFLERRGKKEGNFDGNSSSQKK